MKHKDLLKKLHNNYKDFNYTAVHLAIIRIINVCINLSASF